tara:strand:- start:210 stop:413 length:204 start_codon:yes stop_codon:yes gene_type:complete
MGLVLYPSGLALVVLVPPLPAEGPPTEDWSPLLEPGLLFVKLEPRSWAVGSLMLGVPIGSALRYLPA